jgi:transitional endoplasmic reticulum ATPase
MYKPQPTIAKYYRRLYRIARRTVTNIRYLRNRSKLKSNKNIEFPKPLSAKIASITDGFSFAYLKEAFVAALLHIVGNEAELEIHRDFSGVYDYIADDDFESLLFWKEMKKQIEILRKEIHDSEGQL